jgi:hypothetical protein
MEVTARSKPRCCEITGLDAVTLQPAAGAHGELTGILLVRALLESQGNPRKKILTCPIPRTAPIPPRRASRATRCRTSVERSGHDRSRRAGRASMKMWRR